ncbi:unnamed protein product [Symbiodinium necroappetens]|uniref:Uncharacterized protein n=1 Tax=Symbiodinium necroappetens TaxID=1628268 RepID=A0A812ITD2_9DINO|nr:unnamed protein product [Symbiodinium necroappetens]
MEPDRGCGSAPPGLEVGVDVGTLRKLLMEQSDRIRESGDRVLGEAITRIQQKHEEYFVLIDATVQQLSERCNSLASRLRMLAEGQHFAKTKEDAHLGMMVLMVALFLWELATLTTVGTTGMLTAGRGFVQKSAFSQSGLATSLAIVGVPEFFDACLDSKNRASSPLGLGLDS